MARPYQGLEAKNNNPMHAGSETTRIIIIYINEFTVTTLKFACATNIITKPYLNLQPGFKNVGPQTDHSDIFRGFTQFLHKSSRL
jgi:hypothetical protein